jgi:4-coumarate--CoA ligase
MQIATSPTNMVGMLSSLYHPALTNKLVVYVDIAAKRKFTFHDVRATAEQFGQALLCEWAWRKGDTLALITPNFANVASVMFGILYAGGVVCPLNHLSTVGELARSLEASNAKAMVTSSSCLDVAQEAARIVGISHDRILLIDEVILQGTLQHFSKLRSSLQASVRPQIDPMRIWLSSYTRLARPVSQKVSC